MKRCSRCVLPESYPNIVIDEQGVCNQCHEYEPASYLGEEALRDLFAKTASSSQWDCLVPLSGGRDSTYTLYQLVRKYQRRVLVYNYDNGFVEPVAKENIQHIADELDVQVIYRKSKQDIQRQNVRWLTKLNIKKSPGHVQAYLCSGCRNGIWGGAFQVAEEYDIPLIVFGESTMESGGFKRILAPMFVPTLKEKLFFALRMPYHTLQRKKIENFLFEEFPLPDPESKIKKINFFEFEEWDEKKIVSTIENEIGWQKKKGQSSWRFDCQIHALVNAIVYNLLGMTEKEELYSKLIREGKMTRNEALERIRRSDEEVDMELKIAEKVLDSLQLTKEEKDKIMHYCSGTAKLINKF